MIPVALLGTGGLLPERVLTTAELLSQTTRDDKPEELIAHSGIARRGWWDAGMSCAQIGARVLRDALTDAGLEATDLRRLIFTTSTGGDTTMPATANALQDAAGIGGHCDAFDVSNACMGFVTAFDLAARSVATGLGPVAIVVVEQPSVFIKPSDPRPWLVFGDAAAAAILGPSVDDSGVLASVLGNDGRLRDGVMMAHGGLTGQRETLVFRESNQRIGREAVGALNRVARAVLDQAGLGLDDIDWLVPHQPNGRLLQATIDILKIDPERVTPLVRDMGSTGAASIGYGLHHLRQVKDVKPGDRTLLLGVGAGMSYGGLIYQEPKEA
jgi:3-oxoacyl-[acyl-carrier-protein] synthase III